MRHMLAVGHQHDHLHAFGVIVAEGTAFKIAAHQPIVDVFAVDRPRRRVEQCRAPFHAQHDRGVAARLQPVDLRLQLHPVLTGHPHHIGRRLAAEVCRGVGPGIGCVGGVHIATRQGAVVMVRPRHHWQRHIARNSRCAKDRVWQFQAVHIRHIVQMGCVELTSQGRAQIDLCIVRNDRDRHALIGVAVQHIGHEIRRCRPQIGNLGPRHRAGDIQHQRDFHIGDRLHRA